MGRRNAVELRAEFQSELCRVFWFQPSCTKIYLLLMPWQEHRTEEKVVQHLQAAGQWHL